MLNQGFKSPTDSQEEPKIPACDWLFQIGKDLGYRDGYIEVFRKRRSTTHSMSLDESIVALKK